ncbi:hypothetical protein ACFQH3_20285 [Haladaptatus sp. GCM10025707]|uniref:hypothetical protein n=1 Tax=Haladaptatus sp. GCM10025707 TaxID=3252658 RepID=UPI00360DF28E
MGSGKHIDLRQIRWEVLWNAVLTVFLLRVDAVDRTDELVPIDLVDDSLFFCCDPRMKVEEYGAAVSDYLEFSVSRHEDEVGDTPVFIAAVFAVVDETMWE